MNPAKIILGLGAAAWLAAGAAHAAPAYTLGDLLAIGLDRATSIQNAARDEKIADATIRQVRAQVLPELKANGKYTRLDEVTAADFGGQMMEFGKLDNYEAGLEASQLLFSGGSVQAALIAAHVYRGMTRDDYQFARLALIRGIRQSYYELLLNAAQVAVEQESIRQLAELVQQAEARFKADTASEFDLLSARVRLLNQTPLLIAASNNLAVARAAFKKLVHLDEDDYQLQGVLDYQPVQTDFTALMQQAMTQRLDLAHQEKLVVLRQQDVRAEQGKYFPTIRARGAYAGADPAASFSTGDGGWEWHWNAGITAEWSLLDGGLRSGKLMEKAMEVEKARANLQELKLQVELDVRQAFLDLNHAAEAVEASRGNVALAEKSLAIAKTRYEAGLSTYLEYTDTNLALSRARLTWFTALRAHRVAKAMLDYAVGVSEDKLIAGD